MTQHLIYHFKDLSIKESSMSESDPAPIEIELNKEVIKKLKLFCKSLQNTLGFGREVFSSLVLHHDVDEFISEFEFRQNDKLMRALLKYIGLHMLASEITESEAKAGKKLSDFDLYFNCRSDKDLLNVLKTKGHNDVSQDEFSKIGLYRNALNKKVGKARDTLISSFDLVGKLFFSVYLL